MEYYYTIQNQQVIQDYKKWEEDNDKMRQAFSQIKEELGIESIEYYPRAYRLSIVLTQSDREKYGNSLIKNDTALFKTRSAENKRWLEIMKEKDIKGLRRPFLSDYMSCPRIGGKMWSNIFEIEGVLYGYFETESNREIPTPEGFTEIKASQYHKVIEDHDEKIKSEGE